MQARTHAAMRMQARTHAGAPMQARTHAGAPMQGYRPGRPPGVGPTPQPLMRLEFGRGAVRLCSRLGYPLAPTGAPLERVLEACQYAGKKKPRLTMGGVQCSAIYGRKLLR